MRSNGCKRAGIVWAVLAMGASSLWAQESVWNRSCRFAIEVDGAGISGGTIYERRGTPDMLGHLPDGSWFLLQPAQRRVLALDAGKVQATEGDRGAALTGSLPLEGNPVRLTPTALTFDVDGRWVKVLPTPPLLGEVQAQDFLNLCPDFQEREAAYKPDSEMVHRIATADGNLTLEVFFGSWCPHCQQILPRLIKSLRMADNTKLQVKWIGLPRAFANEPRVKKREVKGVPTIIVLEEGHEIGRFSGTEKVPVEESLAKLVFRG